MKLTRIIALAMVGIMLVFSLAACGGKTPAVNVTVTILDQNDEVLRESIAVSVDEGQTYLDALIAVIEADATGEYDYPEDGEFKSITIDEVTYAEGYEDPDTGASYYWGLASLNGEAADISVNTVAVEGDVVVFKYLSTDSTLVTVSIYDEEGNAIVEEEKVEVGDESITAAIAVKSACENAGVACELNGDESAVLDIGECVTVDTETQKAYWTFTKNGSKADDSTKVKKDDVLEVKFVVEAVETKPAA